MVMLRNSNSFGYVREEFLFEIQSFPRQRASSGGEVANQQICLKSTSGAGKSPGRESGIESG